MLRPAGARPQRALARRRRHAADAALRPRAARPLRPSARLRLPRAGRRLRQRTPDRRGRRSDARDRSEHHAGRAAERSPAHGSRGRTRHVERLLSRLTRGAAIRRAARVSSPMKMRQSLAQLEQAFFEETAQDRVRRERLRETATQRSRQRRIQRVHKHGNWRFAFLVLSIVVTAAVVTIAMFETLYYVMG